MALSNKDLELITELIAQSRPGATTKEVIDAQIKVIEKQVFINTQILDEIQKVGANINKQTVNSGEILSKLSNGISSQMNDLHELWSSGEARTELHDVHNDVSSKDGYLPKISNQMKVIWVTVGTLALGIIGSLIYNIIAYRHYLPGPG